MLDTPPGGSSGSFAKPLDPTQTRQTRTESSCCFAKGDEEGNVVSIPLSSRFSRTVGTVGSLALLLATVGSRVGLGQQTVPFQNGIPVAPAGLAARPLPDRPVE